MTSAMDHALAAARAAGLRGEVPVGAVVTAADGAILAIAGNQMRAQHDASAHAELLAMRQAAAAAGTERLTGCDLIVTLEPCPMCAAAAGLFRIRRLVFGAYDPKGGGVDHGPRVLQTSGGHRPEVIGGVSARSCAALLTEFFAARR